MDDLSRYKARLAEFLRSSSVEIDERKRPPVLRCPNPNHSDENPSAILYSDNVYCPVCSETWDIFDIAGFVYSLSSFPEKKAKVLEVLGERPEERKKKRRGKPKEVYTRDGLQWFSDASKPNWGELKAAWKYLDESGNVELVDGRFENESGDKAVISFWYDGKKLRCAGAPFVLYGRDRLKAEPDLPVLIVEGAKTAEAAERIPGFVVVTWNGGGKKVRLVDWTPLEGREIYIYPDDDRLKDKKGREKPWFRQPGFMAAIEIKKKIPSAKIIRPLEDARRIKASGADLVEALEVRSPEELRKYILESDPVSTEPEKVDSEKIPFRILGTSDHGRAYFIGRGGRVLDTALESLTKTFLLNLAPIEFWKETFTLDLGESRRMNWDLALDFVIDQATLRDFDPDIIRGRGAWREKDGRICYHDGEQTIGEFDPRYLYIRKTKRDIGLDEDPASAEIRKEISGTVSQMSFETAADCIRLLGWTVLAPFAGALPWRPAALITGASGSGKTTVIDYVVRPIAKPETFSGGETTEAGVRQRIGTDSAAIVIEEAEGDTKKKKGRRDDLFSLMRQSTSDDAPKAAKGTRDGKGMFFSLRSMFLFAAITPEVETVADDNRIFRINMIRPENEWTPIRKKLVELITVANCRGIRSLTWKRLPAIIERAEFFAPIIQEITRKDTRFCLAEGILQAAYWEIWKDRPEMSEEEARVTLSVLYEMQPIEEQRDETEELVDRILDERIQIEKPERESISYREILEILINKSIVFEDGSGERIPTDGDLRYLRLVAGRSGLGLLKTGEIAIAHNHHEIMRILDKGRGYHRQLFRHENLVEKSKNVRLAGKARRCVIIEGIIERRMPDEFTNNG